MPRKAPSPRAGLILFAMRPVSAQYLDLLGVNLQLHRCLSGVASPHIRQSRLSALLQINHPHFSRPTPHPAMASRARLERLHTVVQENLAALPFRSSEPIVSDSDGDGGVALESFETPDKQLPAAAVQPDLSPATDEASIERRFVLLRDVESSYNPKASPRPVTSPSLPQQTSPLPCNDLSRGDLGSATKGYSPIIALSRYPYKWCSKDHSQDIASAFFDQGKFWAREWDLYVTIASSCKTSYSPLLQLLRVGYRQPR